MDARHLPRPPRPAPRSWDVAVWGVIVALVLCLFPGTTLAQNPFSPLPPQPSQTPTVTTPPTTSTTTGAGGGLSSTDQIGLFGAGVLLIAGIAYLIRRDAHAHAPARRAAGAGPRATVPPRDKRVERSRAKAKAARRQRKRTR